jgi:hypothetical protein
VVVAPIQQVVQVVAVLSAAVVVLYLVQPFPILELQQAVLVVLAIYLLAEQVHQV